MKQKTLVLLSTFKKSSFLPKIIRRILKKKGTRKRLVQNNFNSRAKKAIRRKKSIFYVSSHSIH